MQPFCPHKENAIISFLMDNQKMPHSKASKTLNDLGFECSTHYIYLLRLSRKIPFDVKPVTMLDMARDLAKTVTLTSELLMAELSVNRKCATELIRRVEGRHKTPKEVKEVKSDGTFIKTKVGHVTRVEWR